MNNIKEHRFSFDDTSRTHIEMTESYGRVPMHSHPDYQLSVVKRGRLKLFAGDSFHELEGGDIVLIGSNVPHFHIAEGEGLDAEFLYFSTRIMPKNYDEIEEYREIHDLLQRSGKVLHINDIRLVAEICSELSSFDNIGGVRKVISLLFILNRLAEAPTRSIKSEIPDNTKSESELIDISGPVYKAMKYIMSHFIEEISLSTIADTVGQNQSALCRAFKRDTGETMWEYLHRYRIESAAKLLLQTNLPVYEIAEKVGYQSQSMFNMKFKLVIGITPKEYRQKKS